MELFAGSLLGAVLVMVLLVTKFVKKKRDLPPCVPGIPILGNTLHVKDKPHLILTTWAQKYGPIFTIRLGSVRSVVITSPELTKEVLVTHYDSMSSKSLGASKRVLADHLIVSSDYNQKYTSMKRMLVTNVLGPNAQKSMRSLRVKHLRNSLNSIFSDLKSIVAGEVDVRCYVESIVFRYGMEQAFGVDIRELHVPELGGTLDIWKMFDILVLDILRGSAMMDWRDLFPLMSWFPNGKLDETIEKIASRRRILMNALVEEHRQLMKDGKASKEAYCTVLLTHFEEQLTPEELLMSLWDPIIGIADNTVVIAEWAIHELAIQPLIQERLYDEIHGVAGDRMITEDDLPNLPYLEAVVKETLRKYHPVNLLLPRYVNKDVKIGGYDIPKGWTVLINVHGIHFDKKIWPEPEKWDPSRILHDNKLDMGINDMRLIPFSAGKRKCAGMMPALTIIPLIIGSFVQHFKWSLPEKIHSQEDVLYLTTHTIEHLKAIATPRFSHVLS